MLLNEKVDYDDGKLTIQKQYSNTPYIREAEIIRAKNETGAHGENRHVARIPIHLVAEWLKEAGVRWDDREAMRDVIKRKILSGEVDKLRQWKGTY
jgi:hypothetical protein